MSEHDKAIKLAKRVLELFDDPNDSKTFQWKLASAVIDMAEEIERLRSALQKYGMHGCPCAWHTSQEDEVCDCGLTVALAGPEQPDQESP